MLVCPQCQFENPHANRFCQRCGSPLKPLQAILVQTAATGAVISGSTDTSSAPPVQSLKDWLVSDRYLDEAQRYQLQRSVPPNQPLGEELALAVLDCQPSAPAPFNADEASPKASPESDDAEAVSSPAPETVPAPAHPYVALQMQLFPALPELQAVWERQGYTALVLEDRSGWRSLMDTWSQSDPDPLEVVHWFYEMTELWDALGPWGGRSSLLLPDNLRIDDDQILCLQRIYYDNADQSLGLADLGECWQHLLSPHRDGGTCGALLTLAEAMVQGKLPGLGQVQLCLAELAESLQGEEDPLGASASDAAWSTEDGEDNDDSLPPLGSVTVDDPDGEDPSDAGDVFENDNLDEESDLDTLDTFDQAPPGAAADEDSAAPGVEVFAGDMISDEDLMANFDDEDRLDDSLHEDVTAGDQDSAIGDLPTMALPMQLFRLDEVGRTHVGRQRDHNEDTFFSRTQVARIDGPKGPKLEAKGLYILCDGMGGHAGGEVASALAVDTLAQYFAEHWQDQLPDVATIKGAIAAANQVIFERNDGEGRSGSGRMGTTLVMVLLQDTEAVVAHVGDSRLYGFTRRQGLHQLTVDHEVGQREIQRGVEPAIAYARPDAYQLTQALGPRSSEEVVPSVKTMPIMEDILLLLCSDGLSDNDLLEHHVTTHVEPLLKSRADLDDGVSQLIDLANEHNGHDNITALAVRLKLRPNMDALQG